jgi:hypothetical protein
VRQVLNSYINDPSPFRSAYKYVGGQMLMNEFPGQDINYYSQVIDSFANSGDQNPYNSARNYILSAKSPQNPNQVQNHGSGSFISIPVNISSYANVSNAASTSNNSNPNMKRKEENENEKKFDCVKFILILIITIISLINNL